MSQHRVQHLVVDTNAFINNAPIREFGKHIYTIQEVINEVTSKKQLRHLSFLSYDLIIKDVFSENIKYVTEFSKKTGDYSSLSAVDIKVIALTLQLEKEKVGVKNLNDNPIIQRGIIHTPQSDSAKKDPGFFQLINDENNIEADLKNDDSNKVNNDNDSSDEDYDELRSKLNNLQMDNNDLDADILIPIKKDDENIPEDDDEINRGSESSDEYSSNDEEDDDGDWITVDNIEHVKKQVDDSLFSDETAVVSCVTADFAMQNLLKQIGLNVSAYDGRLVRRVRTFILRCVTCFKTTSVLTKTFCPKCGHASLKKVSVTLDEDGKQHIFINTKRPLTSRGKRFTLPAPRGGQHAQNPILNADQGRANHRPTKLARMKNNPLNPDYIAGFSPFVMRDVNSKSAVLGIRNQTDIKNWMRKNPNEVRRKRK